MISYNEVKQITKKFKSRLRTHYIQVLMQVTPSVVHVKKYNTIYFLHQKNKSEFVKLGSSSFVTQNMKRRNSLKRKRASLSYFPFEHKSRRRSHKKLIITRRPISLYGILTCAPNHPRLKDSRNLASFFLIFSRRFLNRKR